MRFAILFVLFLFPKAALCDTVYVIHVLFSDSERFWPHYLDGWSPRRFETLNDCIVARENIKRYLKINDEIPQAHTVFCVRMTVDGYGEGVESFIRSLGSEM